MATLIGLMLGAGLLGIWLAVTSSPEQSTASPAAPTAMVRRTRRMRLSQLAAGLALGSVALVLTGLLAVAVLAVGLGAAIPVVWRRRTAQRIRDRRAQAWPDVIDSLVSAVRAGMSLPEALATLATRGPEVFQPEFGQFADDYRTTGRFSQCVDALRDRLADPVADRVCEGMLLAREVGGTELGLMLRTLGDFVRQDIRLRGEAVARQSWIVNGARLAVAAPWLVLIFMSSQPEVVAVYRTPSGIVVLLVAAAACALAYWMMMRICRLPQEARLGS